MIVHKEYLVSSQPKVLSISRHASLHGSFWVLALESTGLSREQDECRLSDQELLDVVQRGLSVSAVKDYLEKKLKV